MPELLSSLISIDEPIIRDVLDAVTDGWWHWNFTEGTIYLSPNLKALLGYADHEVENSEAGWKSILLPDDLERVETHLKAHLEEGKPYILPARYIHKDGSIVWVICRGQAIRNDAGEYYRMIGTHTDITTLKHAEATLQQLASTDELTQLPNRTAFVKALVNKLELSQHSNQPFALLYVDLDDFKGINDSHGHHYGDMFLASIAHKMRTTLTESDFIARLGGDEFVILLNLPDGSQRHLTLSKRLTDILSRPITLNDHVCQSTCSIGIAVYPDSGTTRQELMKQADIAMYEAKNSGKNAYRLAKPIVDKAAP